MHFGSDNWAGAAPEVIAAIAAANQGYAPAYGADDLTRNVTQKFCELFERDVAVFFVATGGGANCLALSALTPPYGMIVCHEESHIEMDECGGPEFYTGGAKLVPTKGFAGKLSAGAVRARLAGYPDRPPHGMPAKALSLTQATECGAVYTVDEIAALGEAADEFGLSVHMDGARFANALVSLDVSPAEMTWRAGVDVLCFGGTKNGCIAAEAVVFFNPDQAEDFAFRRKRAGHLWSKQRFIAAQFDAYLENGLWLRLARRANAMARRLAQGLAAIEGVEIVYPTQANEVFAIFPGDAARRLREQGAVFFPWVTPGDPAAGRANRLICSFQTSEEEVDAFLDLVAKTV